MKRKVITIIIFLTLAFIWGHSMVPRPASADESGFFLKILYPVLSVIVGRDRVTNHLIRKMAHFTEYFILGTELRLYQNVRFSDTAVACTTISDTAAACTTISDTAEACTTISDTAEACATTSDTAAACTTTSDAGAACGTDPERSESLINRFSRLLHGRTLTSVRYAFYIAFIDETIQIFSGRGPQIADVWLDVSGAFCGTVIISLLSVCKSVNPMVE